MKQQKSISVKLLTIMALVLLMGIPALTKAQPGKYTALLVYKFTEYIVWPNNPEKIVIGVMGKSDVLPNLQRFADSKGNLEVIQLTNSADATKCHVVYIPKSSNDLIKPIFTAVFDKSTLIVSETKEHIQKGANIVVYEADGQLKYIMNEQSISIKGMIPSKRLASLAQSF